MVLFRTSVSLPSVAAITALGVVFVLSSCSDSQTGPTTQPLALRSTSITPALVKNVAAGVTVYALISSEDKLSGSPSFTFGGSVDGMGLLKNSDGTFTLLSNNEDNFSVARLTLDRDFVPVRGDYLMNSDAGRWRLCSATLATPEIHGFGPVFLTAGESGTDPMIHAIDPRGLPNTNRLLGALGKWFAENAVPLPKEAYPNRTVVVIGDDDSTAPGGQVGLYVGTSIGDLDNGSLYVMARTDGVTRERSMVVGGSYPITFKKVDNQKDLSSTQLNDRVTSLGAIVFGRVEDVDYRRGAGHEREVFFVVTGQATTGVNADFSRTRNGRVYKMTLDAADPTKGVLEVVLDGDDATGPARLFQDPDNITATENYLYVSEDPNEYGDETHDAYLWQYNLSTKELKPVFELDHRRDDPKFGGPSARGSWESSGMIDISNEIGIPGTFLIGIQVHGWRNAKFAGVDGGALRATENQGSQILVLSGLPR